MKNLLKIPWKFHENQLPFPVFGKIKVFKANFSNFLLKYLENLKNQLTSGEFLSHPVEKINFRFRLKHFFHFQTPFSPTFCHYNAQNMRNLEKKKLTSGEKSTSVSCFSSFEAKKVKFYKLFAKILRWSIENLKNQLTSGGNGTSSGWNSKEISHFWENFRKIGQKRSNYTNFLPK